MSDNFGNNQNYPTADDITTVTQFPLRNYTATPPMWSLIPDHMRDCVENYVERGLIDDEFLEAVVCNDLKMAVMYADGININRLVDYVKFFSRYCPAMCWGNRENVENWVLNHGLNWPKGK